MIRNTLILSLVFFMTFIQCKKDSNIQPDSIDIENTCLCINKDYSEYTGYVPIPWKNAMWKTELIAPDGSEQYLTYYTVKDTIIRDTCYTELYRENKFVWAGTTDTSYYNDVYGWFRQEIESEKVYFINALWPDYEQLIYDYNLEIGDYISEDMAMVHADLKVYKIDSILIDNRYHNIYYLQGGWVKTMIEGIGCSLGFRFSTYAFERLVGFYVDGEKKYPIGIP